MKHLGERVSDLVDDRLDHDERDRALVHLAICAQCRQAVEAARHAKNALRSLPGVEPSARLVTSLLALDEPGGPLPPPTSYDQVPPPPIAPWRPRDSRPGGGRTPDSRPNTTRRVRGMRVTALGMCTTGAALVLLASLGGRPAMSDSPQAPVSVVPPIERFTVEHARSTGSLPFVEPASLLVTSESGQGDGW